MVGGRLEKQGDVGQLSGHLGHGGVGGEARCLSALQALYKYVDHGFNLPVMSARVKCLALTAHLRRLWVGGLVLLMVLIV